MGWLWASPPPATSPAPAQPRSAAHPDPVPQPEPAPVDPEIQKFMDLFKTDASAAPSASSPLPRRPSSSASPSSAPGPAPPPPRASWLSLKAAPAEMRASAAAAAAAAEAPCVDALAESLLPTEMSCRQAFDLAWGCNSIGGQFNSVYRYGTMRSCSDKWDDFWFCMRTKSYTGPLKESMIRDHYRRKEYAKYGPGKPSSQDVWESRSDKVKPGSVFTEPVRDIDECSRT